MNNPADKPSWDELFILMAAIMSSRGSCDRLRTACILVKNNRIIGAGYNDAVAGVDTCDEVVNFSDPTILLDILTKALGRLQGSGGILSKIDKVGLGFC